MTGLAVLAAGVALMGAPAHPHPAVEPTFIEPDVLGTVVLESRRSGWPHPATDLEAIEVEALAAAQTGRAVACRPWPGRGAGSWFCDVVVVRVWEDGSFRFEWPGGLR